MMSDALFRRVAPFYMAKLMQDFHLNSTDAAAVFGNAGHESMGFEKLQEMKPTVPGSRGGWGWFQWTGPRRRAFEAYAKRNKLDPKAHETNYKWLFVELNGDESRALGALKNASGLRNKVIAFERVFERAGVKHYDSRLRWAEIALEAFKEARLQPDDPGVPEPPQPPARGIWAAIMALFKALFRRKQS